MGEGLHRHPAQEATTTSMTMTTQWEATAQETTTTMETMAVASLRSLPSGLSPPVSPLRSLPSSLVAKADAKVKVDAKASSEMGSDCNGKHCLSVNSHGQKDTKTPTPTQK